MKQYLPKADDMRSALVKKILKEGLTVHDVAVGCLLGDITMKKFLEGEGNFVFTTLLKIATYLKLIPQDDDVTKNLESAPTAEGTSGEAINISEELFTAIESVADKKDVNINIVIIEALQQYVDKYLSENDSQDKDMDGN